MPRSLADELDIGASDVPMQSSPSASACPRMYAAQFSICWNCQFRLRTRAAEPGFALRLFAFDQHNLMHCDTQPPQKCVRLVRPDLRVQDGEFNSGRA